MMRVTSLMAGALLASLVAGACSILAPIPDRSRYFTLSGVPAAQDGASHSESGTDAASRGDGSASAASIVYGLGPIVLPAYLDRSQIATRLSATEVGYSQWDRWAEPLGANVESVLHRQLGVELGTDAVVEYPWVGGIRVDYQIPIRLRQFETDTAGESHLVARWAIRDIKADRTVVVKQTVLARPGKPNDTPAATAALSAMLGDLGHEIAAALRELPPPRAPKAEHRKK